MSSFKVSNPVYELESDVISIRETHPSITLPPSLQSISTLQTSGNEMLYTTGSNTYATLSNTTSYARDILKQTDAEAVRSYIGTSIGSDVQRYSLLVDNLANLSLNANDMIFATNSVSFSTVTSTPFGRSILSSPNVDFLNEEYGIVLTDGNSSTDNALVRWDGTNEEKIQNSVATLSDAGVLSVPSIVTNSITPNAQLILDGVEISMNNFVNLSNLDQDVGAGKNPTFGTVSCGTVTLFNPITSANQAVTKSYVDTSVGSGLQPIESNRVATTAALSATYNAGTERFTATANGAISIDGVALSLNDRMLVKNQVTTTQNGTYRVITVGDGSNPYVIERTSDFNDVAQPILQNTFLYVREGAVNDGTQWILTAQVSVIDTDPVIFEQYGGGGQNLTAGAGLSINANEISVDASSVFSNAPLGFSQGGTNATSFTSGNRVVTTNAGNNALETTSIDPSLVTTTTGAQSLTNKTLTSSTNTISAGRIRTTGADVVVSGSSPPSTNQVLQATSATTATWQTLIASQSIDRTVLVAKSGGDYTTVAAALAAIGTDSRLSPVPTATNPVTIQIAPGNYPENNPLTVPNYTNVIGLGECDILANNLGNLFNCGIGCYFANLTCRDASIAAFEYDPGSASQPRVIIQNCHTVECQVGFNLDQYSIASIINCSSTVSVNGSFGIFGKSEVYVNGYIISGPFTYGIALQNSDGKNPTSPQANVMSCEISGCDTAIALISSGPYINMYNTFIDSNTEGLSIFAGTISMFSTFFRNNTTDIVSQNSPSIQCFDCFFDTNKLNISSTTTLVGSSIAPTSQTIPRSSIIGGDLSIGTQITPSTVYSGQGRERNSDIELFYYQGGFFDYTATIKSGGNVFLFSQADTILYIGSGSKFSGLIINTSTAPVPVGCNNAGQDPPSYLVVWEYWNGTAWTEFRTMCYQNSFPYSGYRRDSFRAGECVYDFDYIDEEGLTRPMPNGNGFVSSYGPGGSNRWLTSADPLSAWVTTDVNGSTLYWVRCRRRGAFVTTPAINAIKFVNSAGVSGTTGAGLFRGLGRPTDRTLIGVKDMWPHPGNASSNTTNVYVSDSIAYSQAGVYPNSTNITYCGRFYIPFGICTAIPMKLVWRWFPDSANTGTVTWKISWSYLKNVSVDSGGSSLVYGNSSSSPSTTVVEQGVTMTAPTPGITGAIRDQWLLIDVSDTLSRYFNGSNDQVGDTICFALTRLGSSDSYTGNIVLIDLEMAYTKSFLAHYD